MGAWLGAGLTGLSLLSSLFGKKSHNEIDKTTTSNPVYDSKNQGFRDFLINSFQGMMDSSGQGSQFENAYRTNGLNNIRLQSGNAMKGIDDILSSRGLGRTTAGANAVGGAAVGGAHDIASFLNNLPLVMDQRRQQILGEAGAFQQGIPVGSTQHTTGYDDSSSGGGIGEGISGGAQGLAKYLGQLSANNSLTKILSSIRGSGTAGGGSWSPGSGDNGGEGWG